MMAYGFYNLTYATDKVGACICASLPLSLAMFHIGAAIRDVLIPKEKANQSKLERLLETDNKN